MIDILREQFSPRMPAEEKTNRVREFLQVMMLKIMSDKGLFRHLAFGGGTALRVLYNLRRYSEDLDFSLVNPRGYDGGRVVTELGKQLTLFGIEAELKAPKKKAVQSILVRFPRLLQEIGVSALKEQKLSIRVEIDTNPPKGGATETSLINKTYLFNVTRFDLPSLFATKLHACMFRKYTKGRDFYDLVWYLGRNVGPNFALLNNAIQQTERNVKEITESNLKEFALDRLQRVDFAAARKDVERFLEDKNELHLLELRAMRELIEASL